MESTKYENLADFKIKFSTEDNKQTEWMTQLPEV